MKSALAIQCLPLSSQGKEEAYQMVDAAITAIQSFKLPLAVGPFETVVEGPLETLFEVAQAAHTAVLKAAGDGGSVATYMKLFSGEELGSSEEKTAKYR